MHRLSWIATGLLLAACAGRIEPEPSPDAGTNQNRAQQDQAAPQAAPSSVFPAAACGQVEAGEQRSFESEQAFRDAITGHWSLCSADSVFGTEEQGLEIAPDGTWYKLYWQDGALVRGQGFDKQGVWESLDTSLMNGPGVYQLNLDIDGGGSIYVIPDVARGPRKLRLNNMGVWVGDYAIDP